MRSLEGGKQYLVQNVLRSRGFDVYICCKFCLWVLEIIVVKTKQKNPQTFKHLSQQLFLSWIQKYWEVCEWHDQSSHKPVHWLVSPPTMMLCINSVLSCYKYNSVYSLPSDIFTPSLLFSLAAIPVGLFSRLLSCCLCSTLVRVLSTSTWIFHSCAHIARPYSPVHSPSDKPSECRRHPDILSAKYPKWYVTHIRCELAVYLKGLDHKNLM